MTAEAEPPTLLNITDVVSGPIAPRVLNTAWPNMLHTRIPEVVAKMARHPGQCACSPTSATWSR